MKTCRIPGAVVSLIHDTEQQFVSFIPDSSDQFINFINVLKRSLLVSFFPGAPSTSLTSALVFFPFFCVLCVDFALFILVYYFFFKNFFLAVPHSLQALSSPTRNQTLAPLSTELL